MVLNEGEGYRESTSRTQRNMQYDGQCDMMQYMMVRYGIAGLMCWEKSVQR